MLRIEGHQISARNGHDDDHHSFIGPIIIAIMRFFLSPQQSSTSVRLFLYLYWFPFTALLDYRAKGNPCSNIKWPLLIDPSKSVPRRKWTFKAENDKNGITFDKAHVSAIAHFDADLMGMAIFHIMKLME